MEKSESVTLKRLERKEQIKKITQIQDYDRQLIQEKLIGKSNKLYDFMNQKNNIASKKKDFSNEMARKKQEYIAKFEIIFRKKQLNVKLFNFRKILYKQLKKCSKITAN